MTPLGEFLEVVGSHKGIGNLRRRQRTGIKGLKVRVQFGAPHTFPISHNPSSVSSIFRFLVSSSVLTRLRSAGRMNSTSGTIVRTALHFILSSCIALAIRVASTGGEILHPNPAMAGSCAVLAGFVQPAP